LVIRIAGVYRGIQGAGVYDRNLAVQGRSPPPSATICRKSVRMASEGGPFSGVAFRPSNRPPASDFGGVVWDDTFSLDPPTSSVWGDSA
jgi:hypothetical protein